MAVSLREVDVTKGVQLTQQNGRGRCHVFGPGEALHGHHGDLVPEADAESKDELRADVPSFGRVDIQSVQQSGAGRGQQAAEQLVGLQEMGLADQEAAEHGPDGEHGHERKVVDATRNGRLPVDGLEVDAQIEHDLKIAEIDTVMKGDCRQLAIARKTTLNTHQGRWLSHTHM
jgi:hypothetical protein